MSLHEVPVETAIATLARACAEQEPISFFCGAGISVDAPSLAPDWLLLREGLVGSLFDEALASRVLPAAVARRARRSWDTLETDTQIKVKPEVVLHFFQTTLKERLQPAYRVLAGGQPNPNHEVLARLAVSGAPVALATTNFDTYIEDAIGSLRGRARVHAAVAATGAIAAFGEFEPGRTNASNEISLLKPHGTLTHPETIRATLRAVGKPAGDELRLALERLVVGRHLVVIGYSGNDFDLFPVLQGLLLKARSVWWLCRSRARLNPDLTTLPETGGLVVNDAGLFFRGLASAQGWEISPSDTNAPRLLSEQVRTQLAPWAHTIGPFDSAFALTHLLMHVGRWKDAATCCRELSKFAPAHVVNRARVFNLLALCLKRPRPKDAIAAFLSAERVLRPIRHKWTTLYSNVLGNVGGLLHEIGRDAEAARYLRRSQYWAKDSWLHVSINQIDLGGVLRVLGRFDRSIQCLESAAQTLEREGELVSLALCLNNLALTYEAAGRLADAIKTMERSLHLKERETGGLPNLGRGWASYGEMLAKAKRLEEAAAAFGRAREVLASIDDEKTITRLAYGEVGLMIAQGKLADARRHARTLESMLQRNRSWLKEISFRDAVQPVRQQLGFTGRRRIHRSL